MVDQHTIVYRPPLMGNDLVSQVHGAFPIKKPRWESEWFAPVTTLRDEAMQGRSYCEKHMTYFMRDYTSPARVAHIRRWVMTMFKVAFEEFKAGLIEQEYMLPK